VYWTSPTPADVLAAPVHVCVYVSDDDHWPALETLIWLPVSYMSPPPSLIDVPLVPSLKLYTVGRLATGHEEAAQLRSAVSIDGGSGG
jgi:hypothetical protein